MSTTDLEEIEISTKPVTLLIQECIKIISEIRKNSRYLQSGVAAILSSSDTINLFSEEFINNFKNLNFSDQNENENGEESNDGEPGNHDEPKNSTDTSRIYSGTPTKLNGHNASSSNDSVDPILTSFLQLKNLLNEVKDLKDIDSLTILSPYFMLLTSSTTNGLITMKCLNSLNKLFEYNILFDKGMDREQLLINVNELVNCLINVQFQSSDSSLDDSIISNIFELLNNKILNNGRYCSLLTNETMYKVVKINLSLACNKRRSEVLRRFSENSLISITIKVFNMLKNLDKIELNEKFFVTYLLNLTYIIAIENQYFYTESTKTFTINLISTIIEVAGKDLVKFPVILNIIKNNLIKNLLIIILKNDNLNILQAALQCFINLNLVLKNILLVELEFAYNNIIKSVLNLDEENSRNPLVKELIVESVSLLWLNSEFITELFINYDYKFDYSNVASLFIDFLNTLTDSNSARFTTINVPPICLQGLIEVVNGISNRVKLLKKDGKDFVENPEIISYIKRKESFLKILQTLNNDDFKKGLQLLQENGFIENDDVGKFLYHKANLINKKEIGEYIAKPKNLSILISFLNCFDFTNMRLDEALRMLLTRFRIPGESQQIERVVENLAEKFVKDNCVANPDNIDENLTIVPEKDSMFILSYAIIMLNTDLHSPKVKKHMTFDEFKSNVRGTYRNGKNFPEWYLREIFQSIKNKEIIIPEEHEKTDFNKWFTGSWDMIVAKSQVDGKLFKFDFEKNPIDHFEALENKMVDIDSFPIEVVSQFDKIVFEKFFNSLLKSFLHVFEETSDDHRIAKLIGIIDKCSGIASYYNLTDICDSILAKLAHLSTLSEPFSRQKLAASGADISSEFIRDHIPLTQLKMPEPVVNSEIDNEQVSSASIIYGNRKSKFASAEIDVISVSDTSVWFGKDFKAQISLVALFNILKKNTNNDASKSLNKIILILLRLYENCLIDGDSFQLIQDFHETFKLDKIPAVNPRYVIENNESNSANGSEVSLFSAFTSMLKLSAESAPEPSNEEVEATLSTINCIKTCKVGTFFDDIKISKELISQVLKYLPNYSKTSKNMYQAKIFFLFELAINMLLKLDKAEKSDATSIGERIMKDIEKLLLVNEKNHRKLFSEKLILRLVVYQLIIINHIAPKTDLALKSIDFVLDFVNSSDNTSGVVSNSKKTNNSKVGNASTSQGAELADHDYMPILQQLFELRKFGNITDNENYWVLLRKLTAKVKYSEEVYNFLESSIKSNSLVSSKNYMFILGLLDEISSIGAVGSAFEIETSQKSDKANGTNPNEGLIELSKKSIGLTNELQRVMKLKMADTMEWYYSLIQAIGHQILNPCKEIRTYALKTFSANLLNLKKKDFGEISVKLIFEVDIFPLMNEFLKDEVSKNDKALSIGKTKLDLFCNAMKIYLHYLNENIITKEQDSELGFIWLNLLDLCQSLVFEKTSNGEIIKELIKNSIFFMQNNECLVKSSGLWEETWNKIKDFLPELYDEYNKELLPENEPNTEEVGSSVHAANENVEKKEDEETENTNTASVGEVST